MARQPPAPRHLKCPTCERPVEWTDAFPFRPFCSERCRLIDLGAWLTEKHAIAGEAADPGVEQSPEEAGRGGGGKETAGNS